MLAEETWTELRSPHFRVVTNGSAEQARAVAADFERMRITVGWRLPGLSLDLSGPVTVYAARDYGTFLRLHPYWDDPELFDFHGNWERNLAFVNLETWSKVQQHPVFLGYVHEIVRQNSWPLPVWLDRGFTQLIGSARFNGAETIVGTPTDRWESLKAQPLLPIARVIKDKPTLNFVRGTAEIARQQQVNEAWGLVHFLTFGPQMQSGALLMGYYRRVQHGEDPVAAFRAVFGEPTLLDAAFLTYIHGKALGGAAAEVPARDLSGAPVRTLTAAQMQDAMGELQVSTFDVADGRKSFERGLKLDPQDGVAHEELGIIDYEKGQTDAAREHWRAAVSADPNHFVARLALVMTGLPFRDQTAEQRTAALGELEQIAHIAPNFSPVFVRIALLQWWMGDLKAALQACMEAERLSPARESYHLLHVKLLIAQGKAQEAGTLLKRQVEAAQAENETQGVGFEVEGLQHVLPATDRGVAVPSPASDPAGKVVLGRIAAISCTRERVRVNVNVNIQSANGDIQKLASDHAQISWSDTTWIGGGHSPICFASKGGLAYALYKPGSVGFGELEQLEVVEDTPTVALP